MDKFKINKKGIILQDFLIVLVITVVGFFVVFSVMANLKDEIIPQTQDNICRALVLAKDLSKMGIGVYLYEITQKCRVDRIKSLDLSNKGESFKTIATQMDRCWYRYGEGQKDFMSEWDTTGQWCFECSEISFKKTQNSYSYRDFVTWASKNYPSGQTVKDKVSYFDKINIKYTSVNGEETDSIRQEFSDLISSEKIEPAIVPLISVLSDQITYLDDLRTKSISSDDDKIFVVYRFNRVGKDFGERLDSAKSDLKVLTAVSVGATIAAEAMSQAVVIGGIGLIGGPVGAAIGAGTGFITGTFTALFKLSVRGTKAVIKVSKLIKKVSSLSKMSKVKNIDEVATLTYKSGESIKLSKKISDLTASKGEIASFARIAKEGGDISTSKGLENLVSLMDKAGVSDLRKVDKLILQNSKILKKSDRVLDKLVNDDTLFKKLSDGSFDFSNKALKVGEKAQNVKSNLGDLKKLREIAIRELKDVEAGTLTPANALAVKDYLKVIVFVGSGGVATYMISNKNSNSQQYVDLLTQEQYYRQCGTQRLNN